MDRRGPRLDQRHLPGVQQGDPADTGAAGAAHSDRQDGPRVAPMTLALRFAARSHTGLLRDGNEDSVYAGPRLLAVADGMGGHAAGEVASAVAIAAIAPLDEDVPGADLLGALRKAATSANDHLRDMVDGDPALDGMGTTLTAVLS